VSWGRPSTLRRLSAPFPHFRGAHVRIRSYELVWRESMRLYEEMITVDKWPVNAGETYDVPVMQHITAQFALCVIGSCAFGLPFAWGRAKKADSDAMSVQEGMKWVSEWTAVMANTPRWFYDYNPSKK
jgi:hypothetical protein